jgi:hypothetical protein
MASTYSALKIQLMGTGENSGTWGTVTNTNLGTALEEAIVGSADVNFSSADVTLTLTDTNSSQSARNLRLNLTGSVGAPQNLIVPAIEKVYIINNGLTQTITVKNATGAGISVPPGKTEFVYNNGTSVVEAINHLTSLTIDTPLPVASGGTGSNTGINVQTSVTGVLPVANGGTGSNSATFSGANITSLNATAVSSGTLDNARTTAASANGASTIVARDASGNFAGAVITATTVSATTVNATTFNGSGSGITALNTSASYQVGSFGVGTAASGTAGEIRATNNITAFYSSDAKFKENVRVIDGAVAKVTAIGGKYFDWTDAYIAEHGGEDGYFIQKADFGVIAQDVQVIFPQAVRSRPDGSLAVDYEKLSALAFAAIAELVKRVEVLENK